MRTTAAVLLLTLAFRVHAGLPEDLDHYVAARSSLGQFSGAVLVAHEGKILLRKGYGYANLAHLTPNTPETRFEIASLTKAFTAFAAHDLSREGKLKLDASVCDFVEPCPESWKPVTVAQLIHHRSGIPDYEESLEMGSPDYVASLTKAQTVPAMIEWARAQPLQFEPGSKYRYSNTAYLVLGTILEKVSGRAYEELLRDRIFTPLSLTQTEHIHRDRVQRGLAIGYTHEAPLEDGIRGFAFTASWFRQVPLLSQDPPQADGGLLSNVDDLYRWARAVTGDGPFARELVDVLLVPQGDYAAGWIVGKRFDRKRVWHTGILPGMVSTIEVYPESRTFIIWLANVDRLRMSNFTRDLASIVFGLPYDVPRSHAVGKITAEQAAPLFGDFKLDDGRVMTIAHDAKNGWLEASVKDQFTAGVLPAGDRVFYAPMWEGTLTFTRDGKSLVMRQAGRDIKGVRVGE